MNTNDCNKEPVPVYTYDSVTNTCIQAEWKGCDSKNKFEDEETCQKKCGIYQWEQKISKLSLDEVQEIDEILDDVLKDVDTSETPEIQLLLHEKPVTTEASIEVTTSEIEATTIEEVTTQKEEPATEEVTEEPTTEETTPEDDVGQAEEIVTT